MKAEESFVICWSAPEREDDRNGYGKKKIKK